MKNKPIYLLQLIICIAPFISCNAQNESRYDENTAFMLGRIYYLANPYMVVTNPSQGTEFVRVNSQYFGEDGELIRCAKDLGNNLINQGLMSFSTQQERDNSYGSILNMGGTPDQAREAVYGIDEAAFETVLMGYELIWLSQVLPSAAQGDWNLFNKTGTESRRTFYQTWQMISVFGIKEMMNGVMDQFITQNKDYVVYQVAIMALNIRD